MRKHKDIIEWGTGLFEGEGNIFRKDEGRLFIMSLQMKDEDVVKRFYAQVGCGKVVKRKPYKHYAPMWEWRLTRTNDILRLCELFLPFMGKRRTSQIKKAIKGKTYIKERQELKTTLSDCGYMKKGEISSRGAKRHVRIGEKPCPVCAHNQFLYNRHWRNLFFKANP